MTLAATPAHDPAFGDSCPCSKCQHRALVSGTAYCVTVSSPSVMRRLRSKGRVQARGLRAVVTGFDPHWEAGVTVWATDRQGLRSAAAGWL